MNRTNEQAQDVPLFRPIWKRDNNQSAVFGCLSFWENLTKVPAGPGIKCLKKFRLVLFPAVAAKLKFSERFLIRVSFRQRSRSTATNGRCRVSDILFLSGRKKSVRPCGLPRKARKRDGRPRPKTPKWRRWDKLDICFHVASLSHRFAPFHILRVKLWTHQMKMLENFRYCN